MANGLFDNVYNPDVLSCLANLSNDEVFTPPDVVNQMLDMLPQELFRNPDTTFLDPACKTGDCRPRTSIPRSSGATGPYFSPPALWYCNYRANQFVISPRRVLFKIP